MRALRFRNFDAAQSADLIIFVFTFIQLFWFLIVNISETI